MPEKPWTTAFGKTSENLENPDVLLSSKVSERRRKEIERQEELDEAKHKTTLAKLKKEETSSEAATEKAEKPKEAESPFKIMGGVNLGTIDLQAERTQAVQESKELKKEQEDTLKAVGQENQQLRDKIHEQEMKVVSTTFQAAIDKIESKGSLAEQIVGIRALAKELGMAQPDSSISDPALQLQMLQMQHAETQRDREFQWQMQKDRDEREDRKEQLRDERNAKAAEGARQAKRDEMFANAPKMAGAAFAQGLLARGGASEGVSEKPRGKAGYRIEVATGRAAEMDCEECGEPIGIGPTQRGAVCASCGAKYVIKRASGTDEPPSGEEEEE